MWVCVALFPDSAQIENWAGPGTRLNIICMWVTRVEGKLEATSNMFYLQRSMDLVRSIWKPALQ